MRDWDNWKNEQLHMKLLRSKMTNCVPASCDGRCGRSERKRGGQHQSFSLVRLSIRYVFDRSGSADGIVSGSLVLTSGGFVVGIVGNWSSHHDRYRSVCAGSINRRKCKWYSIIAHGSGGGNARIQVPRGLAVAIGDIVWRWALGQRPIGIVGSISSSSASASEELYPSSDESRLIVCLCHTTA